MNVRQIIEKHLREVAAHGLVNLDCDFDGCGCSIDDLFPCENIHFDECQPAKKVKCTDNCCEWHCEGFHYEPIKL